MQIKYMLVAQIEGISSHLIFQRKKDKRSLPISKLRHERLFIVTREQTRSPLINIEKTLRLKVGGFIGMSKTESVSKITLEKDQLCPGEEIVVRVDCDNSKCSKAVKNFKLKL